MENQTVSVPNSECVKSESDPEFEASFTSCYPSTPTRIVAHNHRKFLKLACKTDKGLEWVPATTTDTGLSIGLVVTEENHETEELVESNGTTHDLLNRNECEWFGSGVGESSLSNTQISASSEQNKSEELFRFIFTTPTVPINGVFRLKEWYTGKYKFVHKNSSTVKAILDIVKSKYCELSIEEMYDHMMSCNRTYYAATSGNFSEYYYPIEQSIDELDKILLYQYDNNEDSIRSFLKNLYDVLNKSLPKTNTFFVHGQSSGGKSLFFDAVVHYCVNFGQMGNFNACVRFPFQDCINRRVLLWNDPNVEPSAWKTLQLVFRGDSINVKVNDLDDYNAIDRTPIIILSCSNVLLKYGYGNIFTYQWKGGYSASKDLEKKPLPIAIYHLFRKYNIISSS